jgi:SOS-response transcriptional repressor LexA/DNA-binding XRE family transcriptional regulator
MLGETVRSARIKKGLTQAKLARLAGVSRRHLAALEKGANVSVLVVNKVASVLDLTDINLGPVTLHSAKDPTHVNMRILAETIREAHAGALRAQSLLAEAEGMVGEDAKKRGGGKSVVRFPKLPIRRMPSRPRGAGALVADAPGTTSVKVIAEIRQGEPPLELKNETAALPASLIEKGEIVFRARGDRLRHEGIEDGDLLVVELRQKGRASNGELVIGKIGEEVFVGRWWQKNGSKALMSDGPSVVTTGAAKGTLKVVAAINAIIRPEK